MKKAKSLPITTVVAALLASTPCFSTAKPPKAELSVLTSLRTTPRTKGSPAVLNAGAAFIVAHDASTQRVFVTNAVANTIDVFDLSNLAALELPPDSPVLQLSPSSAASPTPYTKLDMSSYGSQPLSVSTYNGLIAVSMQAGTTGNIQKTLPGKVVFFDSDLQPVRSVDVGAYPDMLTFSPNGRYVLVANEGEPSSYLGVDLANGSDPEGSITIIDLAEGVANLSVQTADFQEFNGQEGELRSAGVRIFGTGADASHDLEPEYIAVSHDSKTAWVTLQDNNALAIVDIPTATVRKIVPMGEKNHSLPRNGFDGSSADNAINIQPWPVFGIYQPDAVAAYKVAGKEYLVLANEGDSRTWPGLNEENTVDQLNLDPAVFPNAATLKLATNIGRLKVSNVSGWYLGANNTKIYNKLNSFGGRSFSIRDAAGHLLWDSGDQFEQITKVLAPVGFNVSHDSNSREGRSPSKGPEPEGVAIGKAFGRTYAFIGLERIGGIMMYDIGDPTEPEFVQYINQRDFTKAVTSDLAGDLGPEGLVFINEESSPSGKPLLVVVHELSGTTTIFEVNKAK
jgi:DNA-binding beta-propeller fold protein YncE